MHLAIADEDKRGDIAPQIEQRMEFYRGLGGSERCPRKHREAEIDCCRIQRIDSVVEVKRQRIIRIEPPCDADQMLREVGIDAPVAHGVSVGQGIAGNRAAKTQMVELRRLNAKTSLNVTKALAPRQLRKGQTEILIEARKTLDLVFAAVALDTTSKRCQRQMLHDLGKNVMTFRH